MKKDELIKELGKYDQNPEVNVVIEGCPWPIHIVELYEGVVELGCGWEPIKENIDE